HSSPSNETDSSPPSKFLISLTIEAVITTPCCQLSSVIVSKLRGATAWKELLSRTLIRRRLLPNSATPPLLVSFVVGRVD
ncbi:hypothetical protein GIB67_009878, partial [Kingdonia uniflora]